MTEQNLFDEKNTLVNPQQPSALDALIGEGKKFKTVEDLAKGKLAADDYITRLAEENETLKAQLEKAAKVDEILERLKNPLTNGRGNQSPETNGNNQSKDTFEDVAKNPSTPAQDIDISKLIESKLGELSEKATQQQNVEAVSAKLKEVYGDKAGEVLKQKATELGVGVDFLKSIAQSSPKAFLNMLNVTSSSTTSDKNSVALQVGSINSQGLINDYLGTPRDALDDFKDKLYSSDPKVRREIMTPAYQAELMEKKVLQIMKQRGLK